MWKQQKRWLTWMIMFCVLASVGLAVNLDTNITLRSVCVDITGGTCTETALWTVYSPNQTVLYDNVVGSTTGTLSNFTLWTNLTGTYYVIVNYSSQNVTATYNIVVEDYKTVEIKSIWDETKMLLLSITLLAIIFGMIYASFKLEQEHLFLKVLLLFGSVLFMIGALGISLYSYVGDATQLLITTSLFWILIAVFVIMFTYLVIYIFVKQSQFTAEQTKAKLEEGKQW